MAYLSLLSRPLPYSLFSVSQRIRIFSNHFLDSHSRFFSSTRTDDEDARLSASEELKRILESKIRRVKIFPARKDSPFKRVDYPNDTSIVIVKANMLGEKITVVAYDHLLGHYEEEPEDCKADTESADVCSNGNKDDAEDHLCFRKLKYTSLILVEIDKGNDRYLKFHCRAYTYIKKFYVFDIITGSYKDSEKSKGDYERVALSGSHHSGPWKITEAIMDATEKWLAARGIDLSLGYLVEEFMLNEKRQQLISWMKKMKDFTTM